MKKASEPSDPTQAALEEMPEINEQRFRRRPGRGHHAHRRIGASVARKRPAMQLSGVRTRANAAGRWADSVVTDGSARADERERRAEHEPEQRAGARARHDRDPGQDADDRPGAECRDDRLLRAGEGAPRRALREQRDHLFQVL
jgi:hypothetical protein